MEAHLQTCASCRRELQALRGDLGLLGLSSSGPQPPARSKERLMRAIAAEPRGVSRARARQRSATQLVVGLVPAFAAVALLFVAVGIWRNNRRMNDQLAEARQS